MFENAGRMLDDKMDNMFQNSFNDENPEEDLSNFVDEQLEDKMENLLSR